MAPGAPASLTRAIGCLRLGPGDRLMALALALTVLGWTVLWARALGVLPFPPAWAAACIFFCGLGLIPFGSARASPPAPPYTRQGSW